jgi:ABC-2 type transport system permease protein
VTRNLRAVLGKEFTTMLRDRGALLMTIIMPGILLILYGYAVNLDVRNVDAVVLDFDKSSASRRLLDAMTASGYFRIQTDERLTTLEESLKQQRAKVAVVIPVDFSERLKAGKTATVQALVDGSNANTATIILAYLGQIVGTYSNNVRLERITQILGQRPRGFPPIQPEPRVWYNPELKSTHFIVPGVVGLIMMLVGTNATALSIVTEKEQGTFEKLIVTPVHATEIIVGKAIPWALLALVESLATFGLGIVLFDVPMRGSWVLLTLGSVLFLYCATSIGLFVSCLAKTQMAALMATVFISILPTFLLSGFVFSIPNMPLALRLITRIVPARYFMEILRGVFLKNSGFDVLWTQFATLTAMAVAFNVLAVKRFRKRLD